MKEAPRTGKHQTLGQPKVHEPGPAQLGSGMSELDKPREDRSTAASSYSTHTTEAEVVADAMEDLRNSTLSTLADGLSDSAFKNLVMVVAKQPYLQLALFLGLIMMLTMGLKLAFSDPDSWQQVNFLFFLLYFLAAIYFSKYSPIVAAVSCAVMATFALVLYSFNLSGFRPTPYFVLAVLFVGLVDTVMNNRYISKAAEQGVRMRALQAELMRRDAIEGKAASRKDQDKEIESYKDRELEMRKQQLLFSELLLHLRQLSVSLNEKELFRSLYFILDKGLKVDAVEVFFLDEARSHLFVVDAADRQGGPDLQKVSLDVRIPHTNENLLSRCVNDKRSFAPEDLDKDVLLKGLRDKSPHPTVYCAPLVAEDQVRGVLNISRTSKTKLEEFEKKLFVAAAAVAGASLSNAKTFLLTQEELRTKEDLSEKEKQERIKTRNLLDRIMDRKIVAEVMKNPDRTFSDRIKITVLLADVRGFTSLSESMNPREVVNLLNSFFEALTPVIFKYDGTLDKYIGDEIMALFGPPKPHGNNAEMAILCALEMRTAFKKLQNRWKKEKNLEIEMGVALNTGEAIVGFIGSQHLTNYTAIGDTVNTAARLEDITPAAKVYITESTYREVQDFVDARPLGPEAFKGKAQAIQCYEVIALKAQQPGRLPSAPSRGAAQLVAQPGAPSGAPSVSPPAATTRRIATAPAPAPAPAASPAPHPAPPPPPPVPNPFPLPPPPPGASMTGKRPVAVARPAPSGGVTAPPRSGPSAAFCRICGAKIHAGGDACTKCGTPV